jgi:hypothetical protein
LSFLFFGPPRVTRQYGTGATPLHGLPAVELLALSTLNGVPALELEDFVGEPLDRLVKAPLAVEDFLPLAISVAAAVGDIHSGGLIHKDPFDRRIARRPEWSPAARGGCGFGRF